MGELASIELLVRGVAVGALLGLALCFGRANAARLRLSGILFCLSAAGHVLTQSPTVRLASGAAFPAFWVLSITCAGFLWAFATDLFSDEARTWRRFAPAAACLLLAVSGLMVRPPLAQGVWVIYSIVACALIGHALYVVARSWRDDLVESRRRLRGPVLISAAAYGLAVVVLEATQMLWRPMPELAPVGAAALLMLSLSGMAVFLNADSDLLQSAPRTSTARRSAGDRALLARLTRAMDEEDVWRTEGLTMFDLAKQVGAPEHRLRRLINTELGYRNFSAYLNERRINAAKTALAHPDRALSPVSGVAYEVGFASLGPFNRAFKAATGFTPSDWRSTASSRHLDGAPGNAGRRVLG